MFTLQEERKEGTKRARSQSRLEGQLVFHSRTLTGTRKKKKWKKNEKKIKKNEKKARKVKQTIKIQKKK